MQEKIVVYNKEGDKMKYMFHIRDYYNNTTGKVVFHDDNNRKYTIIVTDNPQKAYTLLSNSLYFSLERIEFVYDF